jgi:hypothetical protein
MVSISPFNGVAHVFWFHFRWFLFFDLYRHEDIQAIFVPLLFLKCHLSQILTFNHRYHGLLRFAVDCPKGSTASKGLQVSWGLHALWKSNEAQVDGDSMDATWPLG